MDIHGPFNIQFIAKDDQVKVIECNLRVSRSFPFVSKTMGINLVGKATRMMTDPEAIIDWNVNPITDRVGIKVAQFSFNRLTGAEILLGVEMQSTGEVACFGRDKIDAYIKAFTASGFRMPKRGTAIFLSIGGHATKKEFKQSFEILKQLGFDLYGTRNTASYYGITELLVQNVMNWIAEKKFAVIINVTERNKMRYVADEPTQGYLMRQAAITKNIPIVTDIKTAKLAVAAISRYFARGGIEVNIETDCFTTYNTIRLPGLIDVHVHVREPGETHKEDWKSCTSAALGFNKFF